MSEYRGTQYRIEITKFSKHKSTQPIKMVFKKTNHVHLAEDLIRFMIEDKMASGTEIVGWAFMYQPNGRETFNHIMKHSSAWERLRGFLQKIREEDKEITESIRRDVQKLEAVLDGKELPKGK